MRSIFQVLEFYPELSQHCLTPASHPSAVNGHSIGLSPLSRRVLESYLLLYLTSSKELKLTHSFRSIAMWTLHPRPKLSKEKLGDPMRPEKEEMLKSVGSYKVQGDTVAAVMGTIYEQFGASVAHRAFHTRVLPLLLLLGDKNCGLPFFVFPGSAVERLRKKMGGPTGDLA
ncbi:hypothetical protein NP233_g6650 [Leucocoprinus birnbaumii]|uniref:Uncharacterized protein n=1 Tax=Leucocoprinus birnbaumii TaxID=56174 RepID=A0AAD5YVK3_9AGAR|nr:hypothetical protein NP233_g6650 [Leucocoprinus birnbaumii]